LNHLI